MRGWGSTLCETFWEPREALEIHYTSHEDSLAGALACGLYSTTMRLSTENLR